MRYEWREGMRIPNVCALLFKMMYQVDESEVKNAVEIQVQGMHRRAMNNCDAANTGCV